MNSATPNRDTRTQPDARAARLRILALGPVCNPESLSVPLVAYSHAAALARFHDVTLVTRSPGEKALRRAKTTFRSIEVVRMPWLESVFVWGFRNLIRSNYASQALTALEWPFSVAFEWKAWRQLRSRILTGEFDVVLRVSPVSPVVPSPFAFFLRKGPVPFVIGPINGGLPWPEGFSQAQRQKKWTAALRSLYPYLPFARSTYRDAAAIIAGSSQTCKEFATYREKVFFLPENGVDSSLCSTDSEGSKRNGKLELVFVGGLVPIKGCDIALRAAAQLLRGGLARLTIVGDGPERQRLEQLAKSLGIDGSVSFTGGLSHTEVLEHMRSADILVFPSIRDRGPAVVYEALASGAVPIVVDFGGPGDIVRPDVGFKVNLTSEADVVSQIASILRELEANRDLLKRLRKQGMAYALECLTWNAKAQVLTSIMRWALRRGPKPSLLPPKALGSARAGQARQWQGSGRETDPSVEGAVGRHESVRSSR